MQDILLIAFGAIIGANTRYILYKKLEKMNLGENSIILLINSFASFSLGLVVSIYSQSSSLSYPEELGSFFIIGVLGSLSTFSTFIYHLYELCISFKFYRALKLYFIDLNVGILSFSFGFLLGK